MSKYHWVINDNTELPHYRGGLLPLTLRLLAFRGIMERKQAEEFLHFEATLLSDPALLPDIEKAARRLYSAILNNEKIVVYGDFDADGITATAIIVQGLKKLGAKISHYLPDRFSEGYGLNLKTAESLAAQGAKLIITVDNGIF
ncbi:MAG: DHH family phosphoesterase, partial [Chloroflexi bacterium]|nr:DHH family phosphoesterase [Chloroflexota bacterium]